MLILLYAIIAFLNTNSFYKTHFRRIRVGFFVSTFSIWGRGSGGGRQIPLQVAYSRNSSLDHEKNSAPIFFGMLLLCVECGLGLKY